MVAQHYFAIEKTALLMARCNGGINIYRGEADVLEALQLVLMNATYDVNPINDWLATLDDELLLTVVDGEETEMNAALASGPPHTQELLLAIFEDAA